MQPRSTSIQTRLNLTNSPPLIAFCADLQARESAYRTIKELKGDDLYALAQVVAYCNYYNVPLILGGDQVDTPTISDEHAVSMRVELARLNRRKSCTYIDGNHERGFKRLCLEGGAAAVAQNLEGMTLNVGPYTVAGFNWRTRRQWEELLADTQLPQTDILILHGFASQVVPALGLPADEAPLCDLDLDWFDGQYKLVLLGDIHQEWDLTGPKGTRFMYSGSMWMHRLGEPEAKSFIVVNEDLTVQRMPLDCRPFMRRAAESVKDLAEVQRWIGNSKHDLDSQRSVFMGTKLPRIHLTIPREVTAEFSTALEELKRNAFVFEKVDISHDRDLTEVKGSLSEQVNLSTALSKLLDITDPKEADAMEFVKQAMEQGFDTAITNLKTKVGIS